MTDGNNPINLFNTAGGLIGAGALNQWEKWKKTKFKNVATSVSLMINMEENKIMQQNNEIK